MLQDIFYKIILLKTIVQKYNTLKKELKQYGIAYENKYNVCDINIIFNSMNENERKKIQNILSEYRKKKIRGKLLPAGFGKKKKKYQ